MTDDLYTVYLMTRCSPVSIHSFCVIVKITDNIIIYTVLIKESEMDNL